MIFLKLLFENKNNFDNMAKIITQKVMQRGSEDNISCIVVDLKKMIY